MAENMTEEERRRLLLYLTKAGRRHMEDPSGALPKQVYRDPVDERIAGYSGLVRPLAGLVDRITRPGRAGTAQRMNREYLENIHKRRLAQAQAQGAQADVVVKQLQAAAASDDPKISGPAIARLTALQKAMYAGRNTNDPNLWQQLLAKSQAKRDSEGSAELVEDGSLENTEEPPPSRGSISPGQRRRSSAAASVARNSRIFNLQKQLANVRAQIAAREANPTVDRSGGPVRRGTIRKSLQTLRDAEAALSQELSNLQRPLTAVGQPAGSGAATVAPRQ
jgi:hypothetical protein